MMERQIDSVVKYNGIDGLRAYAALSIPFMHIWANGHYDLTGGVIGTVIERIISPLGNLVFLFMILSAFGMCCGYYERFINDKISLKEFYSKRYMKIWPFFSLLCLLDFIVSPGIDSLYELFADLTLAFGLLPNAAIEVIGVGWFIGIVFIFYMLFPFFCYLLSDKKRAWLGLGIFLIYHVVCDLYFFNTEHVISDYSGRGNILYSGIYFMIGGLIFLYKEQLTVFAKKYRWVILGICLLTTVGYYIVFDFILYLLIPFTFYLIYTFGVLQKGILNNIFTKFISSVSMEIYLCHMMIYRLIEKVGMAYLFGNGILSYFITVIEVLLGAVVFSVLVQRIVLSVRQRILK